MQVLMRFATGEGSSGGRYMVHCHNLVHEDHDMMVQYQVGDADPAADPNDPMTAAPPGLPARRPAVVRDTGGCERLVRPAVRPNRGPAAFTRRPGISAAAVHAS
ncbi:MAG: multicopper oxidase domain-containing protein [Mycobacteriales bacterium]